MTEFQLVAGLEKDRESLEYSDYSISPNRFRGDFKWQAFRYFYVLS